MRNTKIIGITVIVFNVAVLYIINNLKQYQTILDERYLWICGIVSGLVVLLHLFIYRQIIRQRYSMMWMVLLASIGFVFVISGILLRIQHVQNQVSVETFQTDVEVAFVVVGDEIQEMSQLEGKTVGISKNHEDVVGYQMAVEQLEANGVQVTLLEYESDVEKLNALLSKEVDAIAIVNNYQSLYNYNEEYEAFLAETQIIHSHERIIETTQMESSNIDVLNEPFSVLVVGVDGGIGNTGGVLADAILALTYNPVSLEVVMLSVPRDSYVPFACGNGASDKIAHTRAYGSECTLDTVEQLLDQEFDFYVEINFEGVVELVDAIDGIVVSNPYEFVGQNADDERGHYTVYIPSGDQVVLNGEQALAFARERKLYATGDTQRQQNQQEVIMAIFNKLLSIHDPATLLDVLDAVEGHVVMNMGMEEIILLYEDLLHKSQRTITPIQHLLLIRSDTLSGYYRMKWYENSNLALSIARLFEGAITDATQILNEATSNQLQSELDTSMRFSVNWWHTSKELIAQEYSETRIPSDIPDRVLNFVGLNMSEVMSWASEHNIQVTVNPISSGTSYHVELPEGYVLAQSVAEGVVVSDVALITIDVIMHQYVPIQSETGTSQSTTNSSESSITSTTQTTSSEATTETMTQTTTIPIITDLAGF